MAVIITPFILKQIDRGRFKGSSKDRNALFEKLGEHGISHFQMKRELEAMGYKKEDREKLVSMMCDIADERKRKNIKAAQRLSGAFGFGQENDSGQLNYARRKFAQETGETKRDLAFKKIRRGGSASIKSQGMNFMDKKSSVSALSSDKDEKVGFAGKLEKKNTGFAGQAEKPSNITKNNGGKIASGVGSNPSGSNPMRL